MPWADDFSPLLQKGKSSSPADQAFRQGYLLSFNANTGESVVEVGGAQLVNLPLLNIGDTVNLRGENTAGAGLGDVVILMKMGFSWAIMGRVVIPGTSAINSTASDFDSQFSGNFADGDLVVGYQTFSSQTFVVPSWANNAVVFGTSVVTVQNTSAGAGFAEVITDINGSGGVQTTQLLQVNDYTAIPHTQTRELFRSNPPGPFQLGTLLTVTARAQLNSGATWVNGFKRAALNTLVLYRVVL